jgi:hypothetical protein
MGRARAIHLLPRSDGVHFRPLKSGVETGVTVRTLLCDPGNLKIISILLGSSVLPLKLFN